MKYTIILYIPLTLKEIRKSDRKATIFALNQIQLFWGRGGNFIMGLVQFQVVMSIKKFIFKLFSLLFSLLAISFEMVNKMKIKDFKNFLNLCHLKVG